MRKCPTCGEIGRKGLEILDQKFGRLTALGVARTDGSHSYWRFKCDCGNEIIATRNSVLRGKQQSCGCLKKDVNKSRFTKHGMSKSKIYQVWWQMLARCGHKNKPQHKNYGGRGIRVDERWLDFNSFYEDFGKNRKSGMTIERIDNNGPYGPGNCRWATNKEQQRNKRKTIHVKMNRVSKSLIEWCEEFKISPQVVRYRLRTGWPVHKLFTERKRE